MAGPVCENLKKRGWQGPEPGPALEWRRAVGQEEEEEGVSGGGSFDL